MFEALNLPKFPLKITKKEDKTYIFDVFRKKTVVLTPEEWVRQHLLWYFVEHLDFPKGLLAVEYSISVNQLKRRCDAVVFDKNKQAIMLIECKAPNVQLTEKTFNQIAQYNFKLNVDYLVLSNGLQHVIAKINRKNKKISYLESFPRFNEITTPD